MMPQFSGKAYNSIFHGMMKILQEILRHPYHGARLTQQLSQWAIEGWYVYVQLVTATLIIL